jgi:hypothetical protein
MRSKIDSTSFGQITIEGQRYSHDVIIHLDGSVTKRKKKLSKKVYGTSHKISLEEAEYVYEAEAEKVLIGGGQFNRLQLSEQAEAFFQDKGVEVVIMATSEAIEAWNQTEGAVIGLFHVTC